MYALNYSVYNRSQFVSWNRSRIISEETPVVACSQWIYDQSQFVSTIVSKARICFIITACVLYLCDLLLNFVSSAVSDVVYAPIRIIFMLRIIRL